MARQKANNTSVRNFDTIYLKKSVLATRLNSRLAIYIPKGYYDVIGNNEKEFLLAINKSEDGQKFQPDTKMLYVVSRKEVLKNSKVVHTH